MKLTSLLTLILTFSLTHSVCAQGKIDAAERRLSTLVIDAGHGGKDPGCTWGDKKEKDLNLKIALLLGSMVEEAYPDVKVIYTRSDDRFIELHTRGDIANRAGADLFISIHTDAVGNNEAHGSSTYIMGNDKSEKNLAVAQRENSVIVMEGDYEAKYEGYDPNSAESFIIFSLMQYAHAEQSMVFAEMVQKHYAKNTPITDRGARQGPYLVLWRTAMPSVLTEMGFMTNKNDRDYLHSEVGQKQVAKSLFDAFSEYRARCNAQADESAKQPAPAPKPTPKPEAKPVAKEEPKPAAKPAPAPKPTVKEEAKPAAKPAVKEEPKVVEGEKIADKAEYFVQICTLSAKSNPSDRKFGKYAGRIEQRQTATGKWRCLIPAASLQEARVLQKDAEKYFAGAFVVEIKGDSITRK